MSRFVPAGVVAAGMVAVAACAADHTTDSTDAVKKGVADGKAVLVDVREEGEWKDGHLKDARHLALSDIKVGVPADKLKEKLSEGKIVYLHCAAGGRCRVAADHLKKLGYDARPLKDGYDNLLKAGFEKAK
ncbi:MAG: rhodanese-like domain-containing protein [Isosphaera sp.]|nr:rhodanese-like domain-containing protein [Isosphaera sp.]